MRSSVIYFLLLQTANYQGNALKCFQCNTASPSSNFLKDALISLTQRLSNNAPSCHFGRTGITSAHLVNCKEDSECFKVHMKAYKKTSGASRQLHDIEFEKVYRGCASGPDYCAENEINEGRKEITCSTCSKDACNDCAARNPSFALLLLVFVARCLV